MHMYKLILWPFGKDIHIFYSPGGKRDEKLILPTNSSLSVTLDRNEVNAGSTAVILLY